MTHYVDAVNMILGTTYPTSVVAHGGTYVWKEDREHCDTFRALLEYPEGLLMSWGMGLGNAAGRYWTIHGTKGMLDLDKWMLLPDGGKDTTVNNQKIQPEPSTSHMGNWLECLRSRKRPVADIAFGHQHAVATIMAAAALHLGRRQKYDVRNARSSRDNTAQREPTMKEKKTIRAGIVGSGFAARFHFEALSKIYGTVVDVVGVYSIDAQTAKPYAAEREIRCFDTIEALLDEVDVVHVCVPPIGHEEVAVAALARDKFAICEKPLTGYFGDGSDDFHWRSSFPTCRWPWTAALANVDRADP